MTHLEKGQTLLSRFSLVDLLGEGGMGQVWLVQDLELQVHIAIKVLNPSLTARSDKVELLKDECRKARRLNHPHIVRIFDFHRSGDLVFISMEYVDGEDLHAYQRRLGILPYAEVIERLQPIVRALSYAHHMGLVHRDVKPGNILLDRQGSPKLADFGIAALLDPSGNAFHMTSGGSLYYMSPQQMERLNPVPSDDIYALGVLMYQLLTGHPPFYPEISPRRIRTEVPPKVNEQLERMNVDMRIPASLDLLIGRLLAKVPRERPSSLEEILNELERIRHIPSYGTMPPAFGPEAPGITPLSVGEGEIIKPARVAEDDKGPPYTEKTKHHLGVSILICALVGVLAGGGFLLHYLSQNPIRIAEVLDQKVGVAPQKGERRIDSGVDEAELQEVQPKSALQPALEKEKAEQGLARFLLAKKALDEKGIGEWGGDLHAEMVRLGKEADEAFMKKAYVAAGEKYEKALAKAEAIEEQTGAALGRLLEEGRQALVDGDGERARHDFTVALMIDPTNEVARHNLERAKKMETVMGLIDSAKRHEKSDNLPFALADYREAVRMDPESDQARKGFERVKDLIAGEEFQALMSSGFSALNENRYEKARAAFQKAWSFKPDSREVQDALSQVDQAIRLARIKTLRDEALAAEGEEDWGRALNAYLAVLDLDATIQFAARGKERSMERLQAEKRLDYYLRDPGLLESDRHLANATALLEEVKPMEQKGPRLAARIERLDHLVKLAKTPVKVTLESDNLTEVAVYKVGRLGRFYSMELDLRPGIYTVVGMRDGYRDVRQEIVVKAGQNRVRASVKCEEAI